MAWWGGVKISILFGAIEEMFHKRIEAGLALNTQLKQIVDPLEKEAKLGSEAEKNWCYYQRFHFHATGIVAMMMGLLLFLNFLSK